MRVAGTLMVVSMIVQLLVSRGGPMALIRRVIRTIGTRLVVFVHALRVRPDRISIPEELVIPHQRLIMAVLVHIQHGRIKTQK